MLQLDEEVLYKTRLSYAKKRQGISVARGARLKPKPFLLLEAFIGSIIIKTKMYKVHEFLNNANMLLLVYTYEVRNVLFISTYGGNSPRAEGFLNSFFLTSHLWWNSILGFVKSDEL